MAAAENGHYNVVKTLISRGADFDGMSGFEKVPPGIRAEMNSSLTLARCDMEEMKDPFKRSSAFLKACWGGHVQVKPLLNVKISQDFPVVKP